MDDDNLESRIDALYQLVPGEFVAARNALSKELSAAGGKEAAQRVKKLAKATVTAWAVNRVVREQADEYQKAQDAGEAVRRALAGEGSIQAAMASRRQAVDALTQAAVAHLESIGGSAGPDSVRRMSRTIEALVTAPVEGVVPGRLTHDLDPPGFEAVMGMALSIPAKRVRKKKAPKTKSRKPRAGQPTARSRTREFQAAERQGAPPAGRHAGPPELKIVPKSDAKQGAKPRAKSTARSTAKATAKPQADTAAAADRDKARRAELRAARSAGLKRIREARSDLEAAERRRAAATRAVERTERAESAARAELERATSAADDARAKLVEAERRVGEGQAVVREAEQALADLDATE